MTDIQTVRLRDQILCTCVGAAITSLCTTPLDVIKVRLQAQQKSKSLSKNWSPVICNCSRLFSNSFCLRHEHTISHSYKFGFSTAKSSCSPPLMKSTMNTITSMIRNEGLKSLWSGLSPTLLMSIPGTMIYFTAYDQIKHRFGYHQPDPKKLYIPVIAGTLSRAAAVVVVSPIELVRTKMQSTKITYKQLYNAFQLSIHSHGTGFIFRGLGPSLLRDVPFSAIYWLGYETIKVRCKNNDDGSHTSGFLISFASGAISGLVAALLTSPFDVVKTHRQMELGELTSHQKHKVSSTWSLLKNLYTNKGVRGLFAGVVPRMAKVAPACAIMISIYEVGKTLVRERNLQQLSETPLQ